MTERLYNEDSHRKEFRAVVAACENVVEVCFVVFVNDYETFFADFEFRSAARDDWA